MASDNGGPAWTITAQREDYQVGPNGQLGAGVVVTFTTASGITGSVFVPNADYNVAKVRALVDARAAAMEAIHRLAG
jgi:hypothetical protein